MADNASSATHTPGESQSQPLHTCTATSPANSIAASGASAIALRMSASICSGFLQRALDVDGPNVGEADESEDASQVSLLEIEGLTGVARLIDAAAGQDEHQRPARDEAGVTFRGGKATVSDG